MTTPFSLVYSEYKLLHPHPSFCEIIKKTPKQQLVLTLIYFLTMIAYIIFSLKKLTFPSFSSFVALIVIAIWLIRLLKKNKRKPQEIKSYRRNAIKPFRNVLRKHRLYNSASIDFLIEKCEQEAKKQTALEKYIHLSKSLFSHLITYFLIIMIILIFAQTGIGHIDTIVPSIDGIVSFILSFFTVDYKLGLAAVATIFCIVLFLSILHYVLCSIFNDLNSKRRNEISSLIDDLRFIRIDFSDEHTKHAKICTTKNHK